jgi:hypothetical protein
MAANFAKLSELLGRSPLERPHVVSQASEPGYAPAGNTPALYLPTRTTVCRHRDCLGLMYVKAQLSGAIMQ